MILACLTIHKRRRLCLLLTVLSALALYGVFFMRAVSHMRSATAGRSVSRFAKARTGGSKHEGQGQLARNAERDQRQPHLNLNQAAERVPVPAWLRRQLRNMGLEPVEDHTFKSPFIINPGLYRGLTYNRNPLRPYQASPGSNTTNGRKLISFYNMPGYFKELEYIRRYNKHVNACPRSNYCEMDFQGTQAAKADVLVFYTENIQTHPTFSRPPGQIWVATFGESPQYVQFPRDYNRWRGVFNWTWMYRTDADIFSPYDYLAWRRTDLLLRDEDYVSIAKNKSRTAAWWASHCLTHSMREQYVTEMQKYIDIDVYGECGNLSCPRGSGDLCERQLNTSYMFYLSFENSRCRDYITEKFFRVFKPRLHVVPVVLGGADYAKFFPKDAFVNAADFATPKDLALHLKKLSGDPRAYAKLLKGKDRLHSMDNAIDWCALCDKAHTVTESKTIPDIMAWSHYKGVCAESQLYKYVAETMGIKISD